LKLSEQLQLEIYALREDRENLKEQVESLTIQNKDLQKKIRELNLTIQRSKLKLDSANVQTALAREDKQLLTTQLARVNLHTDEALHLATVSEHYRKHFAQSLQLSKVTNEHSDNMLIELKYQLSLKDMQADIQGDQLKSLYDAINELGEGKKQADKKQFELEATQRRFAEITSEKTMHD
jgi:chromosome segregation ATPase